jgi:hypothetical protein
MCRRNSAGHVAPLGARTDKLGFSECLMLGTKRTCGGGPRVATVAMASSGTGSGLSRRKARAE